MNLTLLRQTRHLAIYYDSWNNWLFLDWQGKLTLGAVQQGCLAIVSCCCDHPYQRVLSSNALVTGVALNVTAWLGLEFLPHLQQIGVEQIAWVRAVSGADRRLANIAQNWLPQLTFSVFDELEPAVEWLQHTQPVPDSAPGLMRRLPARQEQFATHAQQLVQRVTALVVYRPRA